MQTLDQQGKGRRPYIGVTGITTLEEARAVAATFREALGDAAPHGHIGMAGYLLRQQQLAGGTAGAPRFAPIELLPSLLAETGRCAVNTVHYLAHGETALSAQLAALLAHEGLYESGLCRAIQLNMVWPRPEEMARARERHPDLCLILQLGGRILRRATPEEIAERLFAYRDAATHVLLDPSGGAGKPFTASFIAPFYRLAVEALPHAGIVLAGGFAPENVEVRLGELRETLGSDRFSIDAEGGLRELAGEPEPIDRLSIGLVRGYVAGAAKGFAARADRCG